MWSLSYTLLLFFTSIYSALHFFSPRIQGKSFDWYGATTLLIPGSNAIAAWRCKKLHALFPLAYLILSSESDHATLLTNGDDLLSVLRDGLTELREGQFRTCQAVPGPGRSVEHLLYHVPLRTWHGTVFRVNLAGAFPKDSTRLPRT